MLLVHDWIDFFLAKFYVHSIHFLLYIFLLKLTSLVPGKKKTEESYSPKLWVLDTKTQLIFYKKKKKEDRTGCSFRHSGKENQ